MTTSELVEKIRRMKAQNETAMAGTMVPPPSPDMATRVRSQLQTPAPQENVPAPGPVAQHPYVQAEQLEAEAQPRSTQPQDWKEILGESLLGAMQPGGYAGRMQNRQVMERQRQQDLTERVRAARQQGFQQQQLYQQDQNQQLNRGLQQEQLNFEKVKQAKAEELANRPRLANIPANQTFGTEDPVTGNFTPQGQTAPNPATARAPRTVTTEEGVFVLNDDGTRGNRIGDRPRPASREGTITPNAEANLVRQLSGEWGKATKDVQELYRANTIMKAGMEAARRGDLNAGAQAVLVTFQKFLDPTSVVRESEYARSPQGLSVANRISGFTQRLQQGGAGVPLPELETFAKLAEEINNKLAAEGTSLLSAQRQRLGTVAKRYNIPDELVFPPFDYRTTTDNNSAVPAVGGTFNGARVLSVEEVK